jgi:hypothetical protein
MRVVLLILAAGIIVADADSAEQRPKVIFAARTLEPPQLDGLLNDPCWGQAAAVTDFLQFDPVEGNPPTEQTSVQLLYDNHALYVGVFCADQNSEGIVRQLSRRDRSTEADRFTVMIDSYMDHQTAFVFSTNVSGVQSDGVLSQGGSMYDNTWDAVWTAKTRLGKPGWSAEFAIPWNALRFAEGSYRWGINFRRYISRKKETLEWVMVTRGELYSIPLWGTVEGISGITPPLHLEIAPYVSATRTMTTGRVSQAAPAGNSWAVGGDIKYGVSRNFTLDATINPDFGQVEVDQAVLNLTVFETRFPEKRPFFLEGAQMFTFGASVDNTPLTLFFSRRLGRQPRFSSSIAATYGQGGNHPIGAIEKNPQLTTILGAAKVTGRTAGGLSIAALVAATDEEHAVVRRADGSSFTYQTEPRGSYNVARVKQEWQDGSWWGGIATLTSFEQAAPKYSGGTDWNVRMMEGRFTMDGYLAGMHHHGTSGTAGRLLFSRISAEHWFPTVSYDFYSPEFDPNDIGFFAQPHDHGGYGQLVYRENAADGIFLRYFFALNPEARWNWNGVRTHAQLRADAIGEFRNFWEATVSYARSFAAYDDEEQGIVGLYHRPASHTAALTVQSDDRHTIFASVTAGYERDDLHKSSWSGQFALTFRPSSWLELNPTVYYQSTRDEEAWLYPDGNIVDVVASPRPFSLFGDRNLDLLDISLRGIVTFTRTLSLQFFSQLYWARGKYRGYRRLTESGDMVPYAYETSISYSNHDFNSITLNANVLLRWEYLPGSTLYLVWTQARSEDNGQYRIGLRSRFNDAFTLPREDVVMVKGTYWFSL